MNRRSEASGERINTEEPLTARVAPKAKAALDNRPSQALSVAKCRSTTMTYLTEKGSTRLGAGAPHSTAVRRRASGPRGSGLTAEIEKPLSPNDLRHPRDEIDGDLGGAASVAGVGSRDRGDAATSNGARA